MKPRQRPARSHFASGPCAKRPGWSVAALAGAHVGRSHRAAAPRAKLNELIERTKAVLGLPAGHRVAIVPGSDTGAFEMALWSLLGARGVDVLAWESFGRGWVTDIVTQLKLDDVRVLEADYGGLADLAAVDPTRDVVFAWNGTTSGVRVPDGDWIAPDRQGLTLCDATSAAFAMALPWQRLDVATFSWQKGMGGEGAHGMLVLGPRAAARLTAHTPAWPVPKLFRLTRDGALNEGLFAGETINTPSMLCVEDALDSLRWAEQIGGLAALIARSDANLAAVAAWVEATPWIEFLAAQPAWRSSTSICLKPVDPWFTGLGSVEQRAAITQVAALLESDGVAYDIAGHRDAPPHLRIWGGPTVERNDVEALLPWLDWGYGEVKATFAQAV